MKRTEIIGRLFGSVPSLSKRRGVSEVLATVILSTTMLTVMIVATGVANDVLRNQMAATEFDSAQKLMESLDSEIGSLVFKSGSSTNVKASFTYTALGYTESGDTMDVTFTGGSTHTYSLDYNVLNIETTSGVGGAYDYVFKGSSDLIVPSYDGNLGRIYVSKPYNWRNSLDYGRVEYTYTGKSNLFDGATTHEYNIVEVTAVELDFGGFDTSNSPIVVLQNTGADTHTLTLTGNWSMTVNLGGSSPTRTLSQLSTDADITKPTLLEFSIVHLNVSVVGGA